MFDWLQPLLIAITALLTLFIAVDTNKAAKAARDASIETHKAIQAQILSGLLDEYANAEMLRAIRILSEWYTGEGNDLAKTLQMFNQKKADIPNTLDEARRRLSHHIQKITVMWLRAELLDEKTALAALDMGQVQIYRELIEPLEWAITSSYNRTSFEILGKKYNVRRRTIPGLKDWES